MAEGTRRTLADSLRRWVPPHSILGRVLFPLLEERRSLPAVLTWIGVAIILSFVLIAFLAPLVAPADPYAFVDEPDVPPWTNAPILANSTYYTFSTSRRMNATYGPAIRGPRASYATAH